jgi:hypothetical protein
MDWADTGSKLALAALSVAAGILQYTRGRGGRRGQLKNDLELLALLPKESTSKENLRKRIDAQVETLITDETEKRRDPVGIVLALVIMALGLALCWAAVSSRGIWWILVPPGAFLVILGIVGFVQDVIPRKRDAKGKAIG